MKRLVAGRLIRIICPLTGQIPLNQLYRISLNIIVGINILLSDRNGFVACETC